MHNLFRIIVLFTSTSLFACGEGMVPIPTPKPTPGEPIDPGFAGTWPIHAASYLEGFEDVAYNTMVEIELNGADGVMRGLCDDGNGEMRFSGHGKAFEWATPLRCRFRQDPCPDAALVYSRGDAKLVNGFPVVSLYGEYIGCGTLVRPVGTVLRATGVLQP